jgi:hypothetical protein
MEKKRSKRNSVDLHIQRTLNILNTLSGKNLKPNGTFRRGTLRRSRAAREVAELLQRLIRAGVSRYEPDPLGALEQAEKRQTPASRSRNLRLTLAWIPHVIFREHLRRRWRSGSHKGREQQ